MIEYVKICGLKQAEHVKLCSECGADAVGFVYNVSTSPRNLEKNEIKDLLGEVAKNVMSVIVLKPSNVKELEEVMKDFTSSLFQIHPKFDVSDLKTFSDEMRKKLIVALKIHEEKKDYIINLIKSNKNQFFAFLIDNSEGKGANLDVDFVREIMKNIPKAKIIIAGGISENNVEQIIRTLNPFGIDASSSLESKKGIKSTLKIKKFLNITNNIRKSMIG